jgi:hypothetical protein
MNFVITSELSRLDLHDSSFLSIHRGIEEIKFSFDWAKLTNFVEQKIDEVIILGRTNMSLTGVISEEFKIFDEQGGNWLIPVPNDIKDCMEQIGSSEIEDGSKSLKISGLYKSNTKEQYNWIEWSLQFQTCKVSWNSFVTRTEWLAGKLPND